jgi:hypothetical protein
VFDNTTKEVMVHIPSITEIKHGCSTFLHKGCIPIFFLFRKVKSKPFGIRNQPLHKIVVHTLMPDRKRRHSSDSGNSSSITSSDSDSYTSSSYASSSSGSDTHGTRRRRRTRDISSRRHHRGRETSPASKRRRRDEDRRVSPIRVGGDSKRRDSRSPMRRVYRYSDRSLHDVGPMAVDGQQEKSRRMDVLFPPSKHDDDDDDDDRSSVEKNRRSEQTNKNGERVYRGHGKMVYRTPPRLLEND